ncbi:hypothetical protein QQ045_011665 [Rhodiola kirilowii]
MKLCATEGNSWAKQKSVTPRCRGDFNLLLDKQCPPSVKYVPPARGKLKNSLPPRPLSSNPLKRKLIMENQVENMVLGGSFLKVLYLAELIATNCPFAIEVMDIEYLAKGKKLPWALDEREILRMLDYPVLPTLYGQFTLENLSCLVMEYCHGGDLHVLGQKQSNRNFPEQSARPEAGKCGASQCLVGRQIGMVVKSISRVELIEFSLVD